MKENPYCDNEQELLDAKRGAVGIYKPTEQDEIWRKVAGKLHQDKEAKEFRERRFSSELKQILALESQLVDKKAQLVLTAIYAVVATLAAVILSL